MPLARKIGKRPTYLLSLACLCATNAWGSAASSYPSLLGSRIVGGFLAAAADAPVPGVVADLFFHHERGHALMRKQLLGSFSTCSGDILAPRPTRELALWVGRVSGAQDFTYYSND
jgi:MFS family permease